MMNLTTFAGLPPGDLYMGIALASLMAMGLIVLFLRRGKSGRKSSRIALVVAAFFAGPIIATGIASAAVLFGETHPLDRMPLFVSIVIIGGVAGSIAAVLVAVFAGRNDLQSPTDRSR